MFAFFVTHDGERVTELRAASYGHLRSLTAAHGCDACVLYYPPDTMRYLLYATADRSAFILVLANGTGQGLRPSPAVLREVAAWVRSSSGAAAAYRPLRPGLAHGGDEAEAQPHSARSVDDLSHWCENSLNIFSRFLALQSIKRA